MLEQIPIKAFASSSVTKAFMDNLSKDLYSIVKGKLKKAYIKSRIGKDNFFELFQNFINFTFNRSKEINVLALGNDKIKIEKIYIPITISSKSEEISFRKLELEKINSIGKIIIEDQAGMGKSTLLKWITYKLIVEQKGIPILVELKKLTETNNLISEILNHFKISNEDEKIDYIIEYLNTGLFYIMLDGFDEIREDVKQKASQDISDFISRFDKNVFILTSRLSSTLTSFGSFQKFKINGFSKSNAIKLIQSLDKQSKSKKVKDLLINEINSQYQQVKDFLENPFLVTLLYKTYSFNQEIPSKKVIFYEEVYLSLYKDHDLSKERLKRPKLSNLGVDDFRKILRFIGFESAKKNQLEFTRIELIILIDEAKKNYSYLEFTTENFILDIVVNVPLFINEGNIFKWGHKSLQDFFAAEFIILNDLKKEILERMYQSNRKEFFNIICLIYELDVKIFSQNIIFLFLKEYIDHFNNIKSKMYNVNEKDLNIMATLTFLYNIYILKDFYLFKKLENIFKMVRKDKGVLMTGASKRSVILTVINFKEVILQLIIHHNFSVHSKAEFEFNSKEGVLERFYAKRKKGTTLYELTIEEVMNMTVSEVKELSKYFNRMLPKQKSPFDETHSKDQFSFYLDYEKCHKLKEKLSQEILYDNKCEKNILKNL